MPVHGIDGWLLVEYFWNSATGVGRFFYERKLKDAPLEMCEVTRSQPSSPLHVGWN